MPTLIIISATSGAGKTRQLEMLELRYGQGRVRTITTRPQRTGECDTAYHFVSDEQLTQMELRGETLWVTGRYGNRYSITEQAIWQSIQNNQGLAFVAITPDYHVLLSNWCIRNDIIPIHFHLVAPGLAEQNRRLLQRDGDNFNIVRIQATNEFETDAYVAAEQVALHFVEQGTPEEMSAQLYRSIDSTHDPS
jgi:guanylate kinase